MAFLEIPGSKNLDCGCGGGGGRGSPIFYFSKRKLLKFFVAKILGLHPNFWDIIENCLGGGAPPPPKFEMSELEDFVAKR